MNMRKIVGTASSSLMALSLLMQPALAQVPNPGPDWMLVKERKVRTFVPNPAKPGSGAWQLVDVKNRTYFLADGDVTRKVATSRTESGEIAAGQSERVYGAPEIQTRKKHEALQGDVPNSRNGYYEGDYLVAYKLTRYALFEDVTGFKPWTVYNRFATRTRSINYYVIEWTDPLTSESLSEVDSNPEYTPWVVGAAYNKEAVATGKEAFSRRDSLGTEDRRAILGRTYSPQSALANASDNAPSTKSGTFVSNRGTGNSQVALTGSKLRVAMGANDALASKAKEAQKGGGSLEERKVQPPSVSRNTETEARQAPVELAADSLIERITGKWHLKGGSKSKISFERAGKSDNVKVKVDLEIVRGADFETEFTSPFGSKLSTSKGDKALTLQFNDAGTELLVQLGTIKATFVKK